MILFGYQTRIERSSSQMTELAKIANYTINFISSHKT